MRRGDPPIPPRWRRWGWSNRDRVRVENGTMRAPTTTTVRQAADAWLAGAEDGSIRTRSGDVYKPSALRGYRRALTLHVLPALGDVRLSEVRRVDVGVRVISGQAARPGGGSAAVAGWRLKRSGGSPVEPVGGRTRSPRPVLGCLVVAKPIPLGP